MERVKWLVGSQWAADLLLWAVITAPVFLPADLDPSQPAGLPLTWLRIAAVPLLGLAVAVARRRPLAAVAVPVALGLAATTELGTDQFMLAQIVLAYLLGRRCAGSRAPVLFFVSVCAGGLLLNLVIPGSTINDGFTLASGVLLLLVLPWLVGRYARQQAELVRTGWELAERLEREQDLIGERTRLLERARIAGDMHDSLGHELTLLALRAGALQVAPGLDEPSRAAVAELRRSAAATTQRLRELIGVMRADSEPAPVLPATDTVAALVDRATDSGMAVKLTGELGPLPAMADRAAYRVVQEALTNAAKHAPGAEVTIALGMDIAAGEAIVEVSNAAPAAGLKSAGANGYGLIGLDERVRLAGGLLHARPENGGFAITARLPVTAGAAAAPASPRDAQRQLALAQGKVRRSMLDAIWVPATAASVLLLLMLGYRLYSGA